MEEKNQRNTELNTERNTEKRDYPYRVLLPCLFGLESLVRDEALEAGILEDRVVTADGEVALGCESLPEAAEMAARMNFRSRCAERVLLELARFPATDFDELFDGCLAIPWENYVDPSFVIALKGYSRKSQVYGIPSAQRVLKKALVRRLSVKRGLPDGRVPEDPRSGQFQLHFAIVEDQVSMAVDTSGDGLHKRGYRPLRVLAPLRETLAAAILQLSFLEREAAYGEGLIDPCCGSGTFLIEAAEILRGIAPGLKRHFAGEKLQILGQAVFDREREYARRLLHEEAQPLCLIGQDISEEALHVAWQNAGRAGVEDCIQWRKADLRRLRREELLASSPKRRLLVVANPPYGERLLTPEAAGKLLQSLGQLILPQGRLAEGFRFSLLSPDSHCEEALGARSDKRRKLYNGMIKCNLYHYFRHKSEAGKRK